MDIDLSGLGLRIGGRASKPLSGVIIGELGDEDILTLQEPRESTSMPIAKLRERHHALAKLLAQGVDEGRASVITNYSQSRISVLKADPAFQELMRFYADGVTERYFDMHEKLAALSADAVEELSGRLEEDPESVSIGQLMEIVKLGADRTGFGPSQKTQVDVRIGLADKLAEGRARVAEMRSKQLMRDVTPEQPND